MRPPRMDTAQLSLVRQPFDHPNFLFELKHDGFRALAHIWDGNCEFNLAQAKRVQVLQCTARKSRQVEGAERRDRRRTGVLRSGRPQHLQRTAVPSWLPNFLRLRLAVSK